MRVYGIIGTGNIGSTLAHLLVGAGHRVVLSNSRGPESLKGLVEALGERASAGSLAETVSQADVVIEAIPFGKLGVLADAPWVGKVLLSAANYYPQRDGVIDLGGATPSAHVARVVKGARVARIFNTIYFEHLRHQGDTSKALVARRVLPITSDDPEAAQVAASLAVELGFGPLFLGGLSASEGLAEPGGALYNKALTLGEATALAPRSSGRVLVVGATGTLGRAVVAELEGRGFEVLGASRSSALSVNIDDPASVEALLERVGAVDHVVVTAGNAAFGPIRDLSADAMQMSAGSKLLGQLNVARAALARLPEGGSVTLTSGQLADHPIPGSAMVSAVNAGINAFARASAVEDLAGRRVNVVSPGWVKETMTAMGMDPTPGTAAADVAKVYAAAINAPLRGEVLV